MDLLFWSQGCGWGMVMSVFLKPLSHCNKTLRCAALKHWSFSWPAIRKVCQVALLNNQLTIVYLSIVFWFCQWLSSQIRAMFWSTPVRSVFPFMSQKLIFDEWIFFSIKQNPMCSNTVFDGSTFVRYTMLGKSYRSGNVYVATAFLLIMAADWQDCKISELLCFRWEEKIRQQILVTVQNTVIYGISASLGHTECPYYELSKLIYCHSALTTPLSQSSFSLSLFRLCET